MVPVSFISLFLRWEKSEKGTKILKLFQNVCIYFVDKEKTEEMSSFPIASIQISSALGSFLVSP